ncbi:hypothetical protein WM41_2275 [Corynebacterium simulans]|uniref:Uncharacterized protein n=1 Tax=Corynebacterium simulans TaxID=146827 RepID=A0ABR5V698_9CORY|nr:hypothetical protein WM41_2275 [Corynebacterium simulans]
MQLFSAHAEVFPIDGVQADLNAALLRARGGISQSTTVDRLSTSSSPRTRRYFRMAL